MSFVWDVLANLLANLVSWVIFGGFVMLIASRRLLQRHAKLFLFFGLSGDNPTVHIFVSTINVKPGGATMIGGEEWPSFEHPTISAREFIVLPRLERVFRSPIVDKLPDFMKDWPGFRRFRLSRIDVVFAPSPTQESELPRGSLLFIGSRLVNIGTRYYEDNRYTILGYDFERHELVVERGGQHGERINAGSETVQIHGGQRPAYDLAVIERLIDEQRERTVFIVSGTGSNGVMAATLYLVDHWEELYEEHRNNLFGAFAVALRCPNRRESETGYQNPEVVQKFVV